MSRRVLPPAGRRGLAGRAFVFLLGCLAVTLTGTPAGAGLWPLDLWPATVAPAPPPAEEDGAGQATALHDAIHRLAADLAASLDDGLEQRALLDQGLAVTTFVELKRLSRTSSLGRYLADSLATRFQHQQFRVVELRRTTDIRMAPNHGEYGLSREVRHLPAQTVAGAVLTGTYTVTPAAVLVSARIVATNDNTVLASAETVLPRTGLVEALLADRASAGLADNHPVYIKELP